MIKVLFVDHAQVLGGAEHSLMGLLANLGPSVRPVVASNAGEVLEAARSQGVDTVEVAMPRLRRNRRFILDFWKGTRSLCRLVEERNADLIHSNTMRAGLFASATAVRTGLPLIWHARDVYEEAWYKHWMWRSCSRVIATSRFVASHLPEGEKLRIVPNGVDPVSFDPELHGPGFRLRLGIPEDVPLLACVGRLRRWKGQEFFLRAAALIAAELPQVHFAVVGGQIFREVADEYADGLKSLAEKLGISDRVHFVGHQDKMADLYGCVDLVVQTSENEPFGRTLIEAMAMRKPVIGFDSGAVPEIVLEGETGFLVPYGSFSAIAERAIELINEREKARRMGMRGRQIVQERFDVRRTSGEILKLYREVLEERV